MTANIAFVLAEANESAIANTEYGILNEE